MNTLKIVCPHCKTVNVIKNEESKSDIACQRCQDSLLATTPVDCDPETFDTHLNDNDIPVMVDFYSPSCAPCMKMAPDYEKAAAPFALEVRFVKVNTEDFPELARRYDVNMLPTLIAFKNGRRDQPFQ